MYVKNEWKKYIEKKISLRFIFCVNHCKKIIYECKNFIDNFFLTNQIGFFLTNQKFKFEDKIKKMRIFSTIKNFINIKKELNYKMKFK